MVKHPNPIEVFKKEEKPIVAGKSLRPDSVKHPKPVDAKKLAIFEQSVEALKQLLREV